MNTFKAIGAAGLLMDAQNGEILSLVSLPDFNIERKLPNMNLPIKLQKVFMN